MNQKISTGAGTIILLVIAITTGAFVWKTYQLNPIPEISAQPRNPKTIRVACTQEAKQCADGSYVSRTGSNCEFAACPKTADSIK